MTILRHWHPVCLSKALQRSPHAAEIGEHRIVLFRTASGKIGALDDVCPHRRMQLSCGSVCSETIVCPYHGWSFDCSGTGESPGTPKMTAHATAYRTCESHGCVWVQSVESQSSFPDLSVASGFEFVRPLEHLIEAPMELVLDNFTEAEHVGSVHRYFGYDPDRMFDVQNSVEADHDSVRVRNEGPQRPIPFWLRWMYGISRDATFHWQWSTRFSPVHVAYDEYWTKRGTDTQQGVRARIFLFLTPVGQTRTRVTTLASFRLPFSPAINRCCLVFRDIARMTVDYEIRKDARMIGLLADKRIDIDGMKLSRFDRTLVLHRDRIQHLYRGNGDSSGR